MRASSLCGNLFWLRDETQRGRPASALAEVHALRIAAPACCVACRLMSNRDAPAALALAQPAPRGAPRRLRDRPDLTSAPRPGGPGRVIGADDISLGWQLEQALLAVKDRSGRALGQGSSRASCRCLDLAGSARARAAEDVICVRGVASGAVARAPWVGTSSVRRAAQLRAPPPQRPRLVPMQLER